VKVGSRWKALENETNLVGAIRGEIGTFLE
jgi:hypothetical protein